MRVKAVCRATPHTQETIKAGDKWAGTVSGVLHFAGQNNGKSSGQMAKYRVPMATGCAHYLLYRITPR